MGEMTTTRRRRGAPKSPLASKLNWVNALSILVVVLESTPMLDVVPDGHEKYLALAVFVANVILRTYWTDAPTTEGVRAGTAKARPPADDDVPRLPALRLTDAQLAQVGAQIVGPVTDQILARHEAEEERRRIEAANDEPAFLRRAEHARRD